MEKWKCTVCGYIHEGPLPEDFVCPRCKQPASVFVLLKDETAEGKIRTQEQKRKKIWKRLSPVKVRPVISIHSLPQWHSEKAMNSWQNYS